VQDVGLGTKAFYVVTGIHHQGVILFFVVSGFLIGGRVWDLLERGRFSASRYFVDRFTRIYIVLLPGLFLSLLVDWAGTSFLADTRLFGMRPLEPAGITSGWRWDQLVCHFASLQSLACQPLGVNPPLWSLGFEWTFYFLAPLMIGAFYASMHLVARLAAFAMIAAGLQTLFGRIDTFVPMLAVWFLGAVSARVVTRANLPVLPGLAGLGLVLVCMVLSRTQWLPLVATDVGIALGLALALATRRIARLQIADGWVRRGADFSFSLYLLHVPVGLAAGALLERAGWPRDLAPPGAATYSAFGLAVCIALGAAFLFARATEANTGAVRRILRGADR
jgi:peptidoglycan/LPS O-acetylase OafA/YrhL